MPIQTIGTLVHLEHLLARTLHIRIARHTWHAKIMIAIIQVLQRARIGYRKQTILSNFIQTIALTIETVYLVDTLTTSTCRIAASRALVLVNLASLTTEALLAHTLEQVLLVYHALAIIFAVLFGTRGRLVALGYAMMQLLVEICAHRAWHDVILEYVNANNVAVSVPWVFELFDVGGAKDVLVARILPYFLALFARPWH
jgi:hypothetical protein